MSHRMYEVRPIVINDPVICQPGNLTGNFTTWQSTITEATCCVDFDAFIYHAILHINEIQTERN